jgi:hypothetical protein
MFVCLITQQTAIFNNINGVFFVNSYYKQSKMIDFAIIGFPKCGTTSMIYNLAKCPSLYIVPKEPHLIELTEMILPEDKIGGFKHPPAIYNLNMWNPLLQRTKIIICWRDPIEHLISFYHYRQSEIETNVKWVRDIRQLNPMCKLNYSFEEILAGADFFDCSLRKSCMDVYTLEVIKRYPLNQILILHFNELKINPQLFYSKICYFVGINPSELPTSFDIGNQNKTKKTLVLTDEQQTFLNEYFKNTTRVMTHYTKLTQRQLFLKLKKK